MSRGAADRAVTLGAAGRDYSPDTVVRLLNDRLRATLPAGAVVQAIPPSLMGAPTSPEVETRVMFDAGDERLVLMAHETFTRADVDLGKLAGGIPVPPQEDTGLEIVHRPYAPLDLTRQAVPVTDAFVRQADGSVQRLSIYASPNAATDAEGCGLLADAILRTLTSGARPFADHAGPRDLVGFDGEPLLGVTVPRDWVATGQRGLSFVVHTLHRMLPFGEGGACQIMAYVGGHPSPRHTKVPPGSVTRVPGELLGSPTDWYSFPDPGNPALHHREALAALGEGTLHLSSVSDQPGVEGELDRILESYRNLSP